MIVLNFAIARVSTTAASDMEESTDPLLQHNSGPIAPLAIFDECRENFQQLYNEHQHSGHPVITDVYVQMMRSVESRSSAMMSLERKIIATHCDGYVHIELAFVDSQNHVAAWTVNRYDPAKDAKELGRDPRPGERVTGYVHQVYPDVRRSYDPRWWESYNLGTLHPDERYGLYAFCQRQEGKPMDKWGMYLNFMPLVGEWFIGASQTEEEKYFCSQLVASALKWIRPRQFSHIDPRRCTPAILHQTMVHNGDFFLTGGLRPITQESL